MAQFSSIPCKSKIKPVNNALVENMTARGDVDSIDWSAIGGSQTRVELYEIELTFPKILKSDVTVLETFFDTNSTLPVTTQALGDGREYVGYFKNSPEVTPLNAIRFDVVVKLLAWRGMVPGYFLHLRETGIVGSAPVTEWKNEVPAGSVYDFDVVVGDGAGLTEMSQNGLPGVHANGGVGLETTTGTEKTGNAVVFVVAQFDNITGTQQLIGSRSVSTKRHIIYMQGSDFKIYQGAGVGSLPADSDIHVFAAEFYGDATSKLTVSGVGAEVGDAGASSWDVASLFVNYSGGNSAAAKICEVVAYDNTKALTESEINQNIVSLKRKWMTK